MLYQLSYFRIISASGLFGTPKVATPQGTDHDLQPLHSAAENHKRTIHLR